VKRLVTRQAGARRSQGTARSWERLAPAWRVTEMADPPEAVTF